MILLRILFFLIERVISAKKKGLEYFEVYLKRMKDIRLPHFI